jgi:hypothetical protein
MDDTSRGFRDLTGSDPTTPAEPAGRIFRDAAGRRWRVTFSVLDGEGILEFVCLGESREPARVMSTASGFSFVGITDAALRDWLASAPKLGTLHE